MNFSEILTKIKEGCKATRSGWNGKGLWIALTPFAPEGGMMRPYLIMRCVDGMFVPWTASQTDILAEDWGIVS